jgi:L-alanine-DL-glutamate epimerase-like enolase superfamily enzyme
MKITAIEISDYVLPLDPPFVAAWDATPREEFMATIVRVHTDHGPTGIGSGDQMLGFRGHEHLFIGRDPRDIARHWRVLDSLDFHYGRCWPLEIALWDLIARAQGKPLAQVLGARRDKIQAYASTGAIVAPEERVARTDQLVQKGFKALKIRFHQPDPNDDIAVVAALRQAFGDDLVIMVDANQGWSMPADTLPPWDFKQAYEVARRLEDLDVFWLEEPLPHHDFRGMARLRQKVAIRIAGGEMNRRWHDYREMNRVGALDVYQPDVVLAGGITMVKQIAEWVQAEGAWFSPHTWGNGLGLMANLHLACAVSLCPYLEFPFDPPVWDTARRDFMLAAQDHLMVDTDGMLQVPEKPGLGVEEDPVNLQRYRVNHDTFR